MRLKSQREVKSTEVEVEDSGVSPGSFSVRLITGSSAFIKYADPVFLFFLPEELY